MSVSLGVSPIAWINDDMPELGGDTPLATVLSDAATLGFRGMELGGRFPRVPAVLRPLLDRYSLQLVGGWYGSALLVRSGQAEISALQAHLALLKAMGSKVFICAETSNAIHGDRRRPMSTRPTLGVAAWKAFGAGLNEVAEYVQEQGLRFAYHSHVGTVVESAADMEAFLEATKEHVGLTLDTGHAALGGIDAVALIRACPRRIAHVHCKDVRRGVYENAMRAQNSFLEGVLAGMFTVPGDGRLDFGIVMQALAEIDYGGWLILEAEQDPVLANPRRYAELGMQALRREAASAGVPVCS